MKLVSIKNLRNNQKGLHLKRKQKFNFLCHKELSCFNHCCKNTNIFLYPYDVLRLKNNLKIKSSVFIKKYTDLLTRNGNYFPDVLLRMDTGNMSCPFLSENGCSVYLDRPYTCRIFPIEQAKSLDSTTTPTKTVNFFKPPIFCMGQNEKNDWTIETWTAAQVAGEYIKMTSIWATVKQHFNSNPLREPTNNNPKTRMSFTASYDIDIFHKFVFESSFLNRYKIKKTTLNKIKSDEKELLKLGFEWIKLFMWGISSTKIATLPKQNILRNFPKNRAKL